ncbi:TPA: hypothetical protein NV728_001951 [Escherichia coli]|nr:hypothetical protein [Escherichia coli]
MAQAKKVLMTKTKQREILRSILIAVFGPRLKAEKERRIEWAEKLARKEDPKFFELYADESVRPYLSYNTSQTILVRPHLNRRGKEIAVDKGEKPSSYTLRTPSFYNNTKNCSSDIGLHAFYDEKNSLYNDRPASVYVMKHSKDVVELNDAESAEYWAFREEDNRIQKDFDTLKSTLKTALAAARYIKDFYADYPQFSHLSDEPAEVFPDAPLPVPTASTLVNMVEGMGLHIPSPLEVKEARDGSE